MKQDALHSRYRWVMLLLLWLLYIAFGLVARSITPLVTPILNELRMSYSQMGFILGSWQLTYILVALVAGAILDRWGIQKSIFAGALVIGFSASTRFYATGFWTMLIAIVLFGIGGPMISIGGPKTISEWFSGRSRGVAVGIYTTGPWIGGLMALALTNSLVMPLVSGSWRLTFVCYGMLTFSFALLWLFLARSSASKPVAVEASIIDVFKNLIAVRNVQILLIMALFAFAINHGFSNWLPKIFEENGMSASQAGYAASIPIASGIPAILFLPSLIPPRFRGQAIALFALLSAVNLVLVMKTSGTPLYIALMVLGFVSSPFMPLMLLILMENPSVGTEYMGAAGGMFFCVAEIGGFSGPSIMGILVDLTGTFMAGTIFLAIICIAIAIMTFFIKAES
ncbi:MAG: MFS transporter [Desulfobacteraceae bacterium]|jgi:cyanate permease|nr:MFS transporter [Desulfobacteraceae bacterium]